MYRIETESETTIWWQCSLATATATACNSPKSQRNEIDHFPTISVCCLSSASQHLTPPSSRRLVSTLGQAVQSLNESRRGGKKTQLPTGQWAEALLDLYVLLCKCYKRILITSPDQDRQTDRPRQWDCETVRQRDKSTADWRRGVWILLGPQLKRKPQTHLPDKTHQTRRLSQWTDRSNNRRWLDHFHCVVRSISRAVKLNEFKCCFFALIPFLRVFHCPLSGLIVNCV